MSAREEPDSLASPLLSASELAEMAPFGSEKPVAAGELLFQAGEATHDLFVVLEGAGRGRATRWRPTRSQ